jgi:glycosyltransferase involved in cell wall biosynthesis
LNTKPDLSVIVPFYNEEENIERMHAAIVSAIRKPFEMVFVDDGSRDTPERADKLRVGIASAS